MKENGADIAVYEHLCFKMWSMTVYNYVHTDICFALFVIMANHLQLPSQSAVSLLESVLLHTVNYQVPFDSCESMRNR